MEHTIFHVDLDAFFVAVERVLDPSLIGKPVVVGGSGSRGVVACASYEARKFGVHSAMPGVIAKRLCPEAIFIRGKHDVYGSYSKRFMSILREHSPMVQPVSVDEAYIDMTGTQALFGRPLDAAERIRSMVNAELQITASIGIGANKLIAKVASDKAKPDGVKLVPADQSAAFLAPLPVRDLPGLGPKAEESLTALGITTIGQVASHATGPLRRALGPNHAGSLQMRARGFGSVDQESSAKSKSISAESTFSEDTDDMDFLTAKIRGLSERVGTRLRKSEKYARTVTLKLRYHDFETISRQITITAGDGDIAIYEASKELMEKALRNRKARVRLLGVGVGNITERIGQLSMLDQSGGPDRRADSTLSSTVDSIRERFGASAISRGKTAG